MPATTTDQRILVPGYFPPNWWAGWPNSQWTLFADYAPLGLDGGGSIGVMNPASGPGTAGNSDWTAVTNYSRSHGHKVLGYVDTNYAARALADVAADVDKYYTWYGVDGVFLDRMSNNTADQAYYRNVYAVAKAKAPAVLVCGNPGATATTDWQLKAPQPSADLLVNFEDTYANYVGWTPPAWVTLYPPSRFAHLVHACAAGDLPAAVAKSRAARAGYRYVTSDVLPNPWDTLSHWPAQATP